jgi:hypothetical protein
MAQFFESPPTPFVGPWENLICTMSSDLLRRGFKAAALWVLRENFRARRFYEHFGGKVIAEREDVREGTVLIELAYGWPDIKELDQLHAHD